MSTEEKVLMLDELDDAVQLANSLIYALLVDKVKVSIAISQQIDIYNETQPIIFSNIKELSERITNAEVTEKMSQPIEQHHPDRELFCYDPIAN